LLKSLGKIPQSAIWSESKTKIKRDLVKEVLSDAKKYRLEESPV
jgi:hypothetical protein